MKQIRHILTLLIIGCTACATAQVKVETNKVERNYVKEGNACYRKGSFNEAEKFYRKALEVNPSSEVARYNLASTLAQLGKSSNPNSQNKLMEDAVSLFNNLSTMPGDSKIAEKSAYNLGNIAFNSQNYEESIDHYKNALRRNPNNDQARDNLRKAQLELKKQNQNNKDKNNKKDDQEKQDQKQDKKNEEKQNPQNNQPNPPQKQPAQPQKPQGISKANADKILKAMENEEMATRRRIENGKKGKANSAGRYIDKPW